MLYGMPRDYHRWDGSRFVLAPMPPQGLIPSVRPEASPEIQQQAAVSHSTTLGMPETGGGDRGGVSQAGTNTGRDSAGSLGGRNGPSYASAGGLIGGVTGLAAGIPGLGAIGSAFGGYNDAKSLNADLATIGHGDKSVSPGAAAFSSALFGLPDALGLFGAKTDLANLGLGFSRQGVADLSDFARNYDGQGLTGFDSLGFDAAYGPTYSYEGPMTLEPAVDGSGLGGISPGTGGPMSTTVDGTVAGYGALGTPSGGDSGSSSKIVCTAMCQAYGFGAFRQKLWLAQSRDLAPEYQRGYHLIFGPLVERAYRENGPVWLRSVLEHIARHRTADIWQQKRGKRDWIGAIERAVLEPLCYVAGRVMGFWGAPSLRGTPE
jgi:hypothetical protein